MAEKRLVVVTGGASGIGEATARHMAAQGDHVVIADLGEAAGKAVAEDIGARGGAASFHPVDVADETSVAALRDTAIARHGAVDVLVNSAGILQNAATVASMDLAEHDRVWDVNYRGTYLCCRAFGPGMSARGRGAILVLCSTTSLSSVPLPAYAPGKAALVSLIEILACELGPSGVRVNGVAPGFTLTPALRARIESGHRDPAGLNAMSALGRMVEPVEVAKTIAFLCSDDAGAITGVTLPVDCGWLAGLGYREYPNKPE